MHTMTFFGQEKLTIVGGGLAGCEAAWQAAQRGVKVNLYEMRPLHTTGAHTSGHLAELVCSNSLGSTQEDRPSGLLKNELRFLQSLLLQCADACAIPAGAALAVDRDLFSRMVTERINNHPFIRVIRDEITSIPQEPAIIASGPLTSEALARKIQGFLGKENLFFFDAIAPIVLFESIDMTTSFRASRYGRGENPDGDYINCPFDQAGYEAFVAAICQAERIPLRDFEEPIQHGTRAGLGKFFEGCLPIEVLAARGVNTLAFGPMSPKGLRDPHTGFRPHAVIQLRQDNLAGTLFNMVGFQTNLTYPEQDRLFRTIPGLQNAHFVRYGSMHRNTYIAAPLLLNNTMQSRQRQDLFFAGQITGVEGYLGNIATGWLAGVNASRYIQGKPLLTLPDTTMIGALCKYVTAADPGTFQPMKANFGLLPDITPIIKQRRVRWQALANRSLKSLEFLDES